ncbi:GNAT family N-acetyltransferase [Micromonospora craterilacus]|uniref:GNAT family N-acetyltransferase n=1 Tax=Micromonospora craterilacus TaxID=1655439 RepID=A0A2W2EN27_9ACTN|nr:GNAT family N-acetyltransferase [Micromonospora craterilacus]PZG13808.1 GNAT family N-acetyltransferase [Micromonospora craterilacus]
MHIAVDPYDPTDEAALDEAYRIVAAAQAVDVPDVPVGDRAEFGRVAAHPPYGNVVLTALARRDGDAVGYLWIRLPQLDNTGNASVELVVDPAHRRQGVGRVLLGYARRVAAEHGRKRLIAETTDGLPGESASPAPGAAFAAAAGARPALPDVRRRLDTTRLDHTSLAALHDMARSRAAGYRTVAWVGAVAEEYVADIARLEGRLFADAPTGELVVEAEKVDAKRFREMERIRALRGRRRYHLGAVHEATGRMVAWTMIDMGPSATWYASQEITIVDPEHRGHRLGLLIKVENLRHALAHEPALRAIDTWNAAANDHMITINEQLGFRPVNAGASWQLTI